MTTAFPQGGIPFELPPITAPPIVSQPMMEDQQFQPQQLLVQSTTAISSLNQTFDIQITSSQWLMLEESFFDLECVLELAQSTIQTDYLSMLNGYNTEVITDFGSFWGLFNSITISLNGVALPNFQQNFITAQLYTANLMAPQNYDVPTIENQLNRLQRHGGKMGQNNYEIIAHRGGWGTDNDLSMWQNSIIPVVTGSTAVPTVKVYLRVPIRKFLYCFGQLGRYWTSDAKLSISFIFQSLQLPVTFVQGGGTILQGAQNGSQPVPTAAISYVYPGQTAIQSQPVRLTFSRMFMEYHMITVSLFYVYNKLFYS